ncbi:hypothetical protein [Aquimonas sp.]|jgi:hypothetical protein|uniref:hypothetical protein n=1 Tax=Aquimonas sp. TaxID=1872588 RepID=UPI0037C16E31
MVRKMAVKSTPGQVARRHLAAREEIRVRRATRFQAVAIAVVCVVGTIALWTSASEREEEAFAAVEAAEAEGQPIGLRQRVLDLSTRSGRAISCIEEGLADCR